MDKVVRDGKVAVLVSPGYGAGWYSWYGIEEMLFDPKIVAMLENPDDDEDVDTIIEYCREKYGESGYDGASDLTICWVPEGRRFVIDEYDGYENIRFEENIRWITP
jgi:hypothetical protein